MSKLYKWLATGHLGFLKIFGHFYKMLWYFFYQSKTNNRKTKKKKKGTTYLSPTSEAHLLGLGPAQPPRLSSSSPTPEQAARAVASMPTAAEPPRPPLPLSFRHTTPRARPALL